MENDLGLYQVPDDGFSLLRPLHIDMKITSFLLRRASRMLHPRLLFFCMNDAGRPANKTLVAQAFCCLLPAFLLRSRDETWNVFVAWS